MYIDIVQCSERNQWSSCKVSLTQSRGPKPAFDHSPFSVQIRAYCHCYSPVLRHQYETVFHSTSTRHLHFSHTQTDLSSSSFPELLLIYVRCLRGDFCLRCWNCLSRLQYITTLRRVLLRCDTCGQFITSTPAVADRITGVQSIELWQRHVVCLSDHLYRRHQSVINAAAKLNFQTAVEGQRYAVPDYPSENKPDFQTWRAGGCKVTPRKYSAIQRYNVIKT